MPDQGRLGLEFTRLDQPGQRPSLQAEAVHGRLDRLHPDLAVLLDLDRGASSVAASLEEEIRKPQLALRPHSTGRFEVLDDRAPDVASSPLSKVTIAAESASTSVMGSAPPSGEDGHALDHRWLRRRHRDAHRIPADVEDRSPPSFWLRSRCSGSTSARNPKWPRSCSLPIARTINSRNLAIWGWRGTSSPRSDRSILVGRHHDREGPAQQVSGFSHNTGTPRDSALIASSACSGYGVPMYRASRSSTEHASCIGP